MTNGTILIGHALRGSDGLPLQTLSADLLSQIESAYPGSEVVYAPVPHDQALLIRMKNETAQALLGASEKFPALYLEALGRAEILLSLFAPVDLLARAPALRWLANPGSGTEHYQAHRILGSRVVLTSAKGVGARCIAEFAMSQLLVLARAWPSRLRDQDNKVWRWHGGRVLSSMTLGIIGLGEIGSEVARLAASFGMRVLGTRKRPASVEGVSEVFAPEDLPKMLARSDVLVVAAPYTADTIGLIGARELALLPENALLINVSRGGIVDEDALMAALTGGHLAGAASDVFAQEPLAADHPLWTTPNFLVSAHEAVAASDYTSAAMARFIDNLVRYRCGLEMLGRIDPALGY